MGCAKCHECVYVLVTSQALYVIASDQAAKAVPDDVDPCVTSGSRQLFDGHAQPHGSARNVLGKQAVVVSGQRLEPAAAECVLHHSEDRVIVDDPVHEQDGCLGSLYTVMEESALFRTEPPAIVAALGEDWRGSGEESERIHHQVGCTPGGLNGQARCHL
jgi:hypothetical protein